MDEQHMPDRQHHEGDGKRDVDEEPSFHDALDDVVEIDGVLEPGEFKEPDEVATLGAVEVALDGGALELDPVPAALPGEGVAERKSWAGEEPLQVLDIVRGEGIAGGLLRAVEDDRLRPLTDLGDLPGDALVDDLKACPGQASRVEALQTIAKQAVQADAVEEECEGLFVESGWPGCASVQPEERNGQEAPDDMQAQPC